MNVLMYGECMTSHCVFVLCVSCLKHIQNKPERSNFNDAGILKNN